MRTFAEIVEDPIGLRDEIVTELIAGRCPVCATPLLGDPCAYPYGDCDRHGVWRVAPGTEETNGAPFFQWWATHGALLTARGPWAAPLEVL